MRHAALAVVLLSTFATAQTVHTSQDAYRNWDQQKPGERVHLTVKDLPAPNEAESVDNGPAHAPRNGAMPQAPAGFKVQIYAQGDFSQPRLIRSAPNGDLFLADSRAGKVIVLRGVKPDGTVAERSEYATGLDHPFGINFYPEKDPKWVYVANTASLVRFPYKKGDMKASGQAQTVIDKLPGYAQLRGGGHWTRDVVFSLDGKRMFISVGSGSNIDDPDTHPKEFHRADVLEYTPDGKFVKVYAYGIRNCVGEAIHPQTGELWCSVNERDRLGNHLVPDYITHVQEGGFYGWPWWYMGGHQDPRHEGKHPELKNKVITPDILVQPHMASLQMTFYPDWRHSKNQHNCLAVPDPLPPSGWVAFPEKYCGGIFAAEHGSWNRKDRAGYEVIFAPVRNGKATGEYSDFLTGFTTSDGKVWGRPVGVTVAKDGSLIVVDDGSNIVWRVTYTGKN